MKEKFSEKRFESQEQNEKYSSQIKLHVFRHGEKEDADKPDEKIHLTEAGRKDIVANSNADNVNQSVAYGSPRERSQQTAALEMAGGQEEIAGEENFEELMEKLDGYTEIGSKVSADSRLDFDIDKGTEFAKWRSSKYGNEDYLQTFVEKSDQKAEGFGEADVHTYSVYAQEVANLLNRYINASDRWNELVHDKEKDYNDTLERFLGTHAMVGESFLAKIIEETEGIDERNCFLEAVGGSGFGFNEGFEIDIKNRGEEKVVNISYEKELDDGSTYSYDENVPIGVIKKLARDTDKK